MKTLTLTLALCLTLPLAPATARAGEVLVFAAASMKTALNAVAAGWQDETGNKALLSYAGSGVLAKQVIAGAPAGVYICANEVWMDAVAAEGLIAERRDLLGNALVLIAHDPDTAPLDLGPQTDVAALLAGGKLAMALIDAVPAGQYGKQALTALGLWQSVAPSVAQADNVRAALALVATGEAPLGVVYASDAVAQPAVKTVATFPDDSHEPIRYPAALITGADDTARAFFAALFTPEAAAIFAAQGFTVLP